MTTHAYTEDEVLLHAKQRTAFLALAEGIRARVERKLAEVGRLLALLLEGLHDDEKATFLDDLLDEADASRTAAGKALFGGIAYAGDLDRLARAFEEYLLAAGIGEVIIAAGEKKPVAIEPPGFEGFKGMAEEAGGDLPFTVNQENFQHWKKK